VPVQGCTLPYGAIQSLLSTTFLPANERRKSVVGNFVEVQP